LLKKLLIFIIVIVCGVNSYSYESKIGLRTSTGFFGPNPLHIGEIDYQFPLPFLLSTSLGVTMIEDNEDYSLYPLLTLKAGTKKIAGLFSSYGGIKLGYNEDFLIIGFTGFDFTLSDSLSIFLEIGSGPGISGWLDKYGQESFMLTQVGIKAVI
jgi:hypothetical protein